MPKTKTILSVSTLLALTIGSLYSQDWNQAARSFESQDENIQQFAFEKTELAAEVLPSFFEFTTDYDGTGNARVYSVPYEGDKVRYSDLEFDIYYTHGLRCTTGVTMGIGWSDTHLHLTHNPFFHRTQYNNAIFSLSGFTGALPCWLWKAGISAQVDTHHWNWTEYALYTLTLWGRYSYWDNLGLHAGLVGQGGLRKDKVMPILGFDLTWWDNWQLNLIYPVNISLIYNFNSSWSILLAARFLESRYRLSEDEPLPRGIWQYQNVGTELGLTYQCGAFAYANIHVGCALGGDLKITNKNNHDAIHLKQDPTGYVGGSINLKW